MDVCPSTRAHQPPIGNDANVHATAIVIDSKRIRMIHLKLVKSALQGDLPTSTEGSTAPLTIVDVFLIISFA